MSVEAVLRGETLPTKEFSDVLISEVKMVVMLDFITHYLALYDGKLSLRRIPGLGQGSVGHLRLQRGD